MGDSLVYGREEKREDFEGKMEDFEEKSET